MNELLLQSKHGESLTIPRRACQFEVAELRLAKKDAAAGEAGAAANRGFEMVATTGKPMPHWYWGKLVVDLSGIETKQKIPVLMDHDPQQRVGFTDEIAVEKQGLVARGQLMEHSDAAKSILADAGAGFDWQASVYLQTQKIQVLRKDESADVNGFRFEGPGAILRTSKLREVTFTALGADDETTATPLADNVAGEQVVAYIERGSMSEKTNDPAKAGGDKAPSAPKAAWAGQPEVLQQTRDEATAAERERCLSIYNSCCDGNRDLALSLIADGTPEPQALTQLNQDLREKLAAALSAPKPTRGAAALAGGNTNKLAPRATPDTKASADKQAADDAKAAADAELAAMPDGEAKWKREFALSAALQAEFEEEKFYLAFRKHAHRTRDFGRPSAAKHGGDA
jgi:hypothetical protein